MHVEPLESRLLFAAPKILFIRGAARSGGFLEGTNAATRTAQQLADINDTSTSTANSGWGAFAQTLRDRGFDVSEIIEARGQDIDPSFVKGKAVPLATMDLTQYAAIVFGSNNADYNSTDDRRALQGYINVGGAALFITDANFGSDWRDAADSDQDLLDAFGIIVNQDNASGVHALTRAGSDFINPTHPLLNGINSFNGEGVSSFTISDFHPPGVIAERVVAASGQVRNNDGLDSEPTVAGSNRGSLRDATGADASLLAITYGAGSVVAFEDRNTFFNDNGLGADITQLDNQKLALNIMNWLTDHTRPAITAVDVTIGAPTVVKFTFNDALAGSLTRGDILLRNANTGEAIPSSRWSFSVTDAATSAVLEIHIKAAAISGGLFQLQINKHKITDDAGNVNRVRLRRDFTLSTPPKPTALLPRLAPVALLGQHPLEDIFATAAFVTA